MDGEVVRLRQGKADEKTVYSDDPGRARASLAGGGRRLSPRRGPRRRVLRALGRGESGGLAGDPGGPDDPLRTRRRSARRGRRARGTRPGRGAGGHRHARGGVDGVCGGAGRDVRLRSGSSSASTRAAAWWRSRAGHNRRAGGPSTWAAKSQAAGVGAIIYTDIATDGMLAGPNFTRYWISCSASLTARSSPAAALPRPRTCADWPPAHPAWAIIGRALDQGTLCLADCTPEHSVMPDAEDPPSSVRPDDRFLPVARLDPAAGGCLAAVLILSFVVVQQGTGAAPAAPAPGDAYSTPKPTPRLIPTPTPEADAHPAADAHAGRPSLCAGKHVRCD